MDDGSTGRQLFLTAVPADTARVGQADIGSIAIYIILIVLLILGAAWFAACETSLACVNKLRMKSRAEDGDKRAQYVMYILNNYGRALTTMLIGINIMHIACASIATLLTRRLFGGSSHLDLLLTASTLLTTLIVFFFAEMLPKYHAKAYPEQVSLRSGKTLYLLMKILLPLSAVFTWISKGITAIFTSGEPEPDVTEDDLRDALQSFRDEREEDDETESETSRLMESALRFGAKTARQAMTPWEKVETLDSSMEISEIYQHIQASNHSRYPMRNAKGRVIGVLNIRSFLKAYRKSGEDLELLELIDTPLFVRPDIPVDELLSEMSASKIHLAFVSQQGQVQGIITIEDILEELVGEIFDETDAEEPVSPVQKGGGGV